MAGILYFKFNFIFSSIFQIIKFDLISSFISGIAFYLILIACSLMAVFGDFIESRIKRIANEGFWVTLNRTWGNSR